MRNLPLVPSRRERKTILATHVVTSVALVGTSAELLVAALRAGTRSDPQDAHALYGLMQLLIFTLGAPVSFIALGTGVWLVAITRWTLLRDLWVTGKLALLTGTILVGSFATGPATTALLRTSATGHTDPGTRGLLVAAIGAQAAMVVAATALAVFKPNRRRSNAAPDDPHQGGR
jgi:ascorbate-specific PTS system EIIC-type component UlaA